MNCRRCCHALLLLLSLLLWLLPEASAAPSPFDVLNYDTRIDIETNGDIIVTENITVSIPTYGTNKGIIRDIPINPRWEELGRQNVRLTVEAVSIDGTPCRTDDTEWNAPVMSIYMRNPTRYLSSGEHLFTLRYRITEQLGFFDEGDELTWNAVGEGWDGGVRHARATVFPPAGARFTAEDAWLGKRGKRHSPVTIRREMVDGREAVVFEAQRPIGYGEAFTVAVQWPVGIVTAPEILTPSDQWGYTLIYAACLLVALGGGYGLWARFGKDPEAGAVIPLFYPPKVPERLRAQAAAGRKAAHLLHHEEYMSPAAVHYVHEGGKLEANGLAALFLTLSGRGDCKLLGNSKRGITVRKVANTSPAPEEHAAMDKMPDFLPLTERKSTHSPIGKVHGACKMRLDFDYPMEMRWRLWPQILLFISLAAVLWHSLMQQLGGTGSPLVYDTLGEAFGGVFAMLLGIGGAVWLIYVARRHGLTQGFPVLLLLFATIALAGYPTVRDANIFWIISPLQLALILATLLVPPGFCFLMDLPTREQVELRRDIAGLALYIGTAETARFNHFNPPEEDLQLYHRLLPYAVALGLEDAWGKRFAAQLARAMQTPEETTYTISFTHDLLRCSRNSLNTYQQAVAAQQAAAYASNTGGGSSFGGGFGGGAGMGGGGGGGRAC